MKKTCPSFDKAGSFGARALLRSLFSTCWCGVLLFLLAGSLTETSFAQAPAWSRGVQLLNMNMEECKRRALGALEASGYRVDGQGGSYTEDHYFAGTKERHAAAIACDMTSNNYMWINVFVSSTDGGNVAGVERVKLQALMERPGSVSGAGGGGGGGGTCQGTAGYSVTVTPNVVRPGTRFAVSVIVPAGSPPEGSWVGMFKGDSWTGGQSEYLTTLKPGFTTNFVAPTEPGQYEVRVLLDSGYSNVAVRCPFTVGGQSQAQMAKPEPSVARGCQGSALTLALSSDNIRTGQAISARVTVPGGNPPTGSWIGLFPAGGSTMYIAWQYLADLKESNFSRNFTLQTPGEYEIRTYLDVGYDKVASRCYVTVQ